MTDLSLNRVTLSFYDTSLDNKFKAEYYKNSLKTFRISLIVVAILYAAFGLLDQPTTIKHYQYFYTIRYIFVVPSFFFLLAFSYHKYFEKIWQYLGSAAVILSGTGIIIMLLLNPYNIYYYGGMFLIFMGAYFFIKLRFVYASISSMILISLYNIGSIVFQQIFEINTMNLLQGNAFFIAANIMCMIGLYNIERLERIGFYHKCQLSEDQDMITKANQSLEKKVKQRTKLLNDRNEKLQEEINNNKEIKKQLIASKEKAEESDRLKTSFLANMSHEIRTPMNGILGFTELLNTEDLTGEEQHQYIEIIQKSGERMLQTVNDIIEISKIETGQTIPTIENVNLNELMEDLFDFFLLEANKKGLDLEIVKGLENKESIIKTDGRMFNSVLTNLLKNAIKFTDHGLISCGYVKKNNLLEFYVKDSGIGISQEEKNAVFYRFVQANNKRAVQGSGLGLCISKAYVEILDGTIWVHSEPQKGSTFFFSIPYIKAV